MAFGIGDSLTVRVNAATSGFERDIDSAGRSLTGMVDNALSAASGLQIFQGRADEAESEVDSLGRSAATTGGHLSLMAGGAGAASGGLSALGGLAGFASGSVGTLSQTVKGLTTSLVGLGATLAVVTGGIVVLTGAATALVSTLFPLVAVAGALVGGLGALAGAFGAVMGTGILAFGAKRGEQNRERLMEVRARIEELEALQETEEGLTDTQEEELETLEERADKLEETTGIMGGLKDAVSELVEELKPLIVDFGEAFIPLIEDALDAIPDLVENILEAVGGLEVFVDALRDMGEAAMTAIPDLVGGMMDLARRALPIFIDGMEWLGRNGARIFDGILRVTQRLAPTLMSLLNTFINAVPALTKLGTVTLETLIPAFNSFLDTVKDIVNIGEESNGIVGFVKTLINKAVNWLSGPGKQKAENVASSIISGIVGIIDPEDNEDSSFLDALSGRVGTVIDDVATWLDEGGGKTKIKNLITGFFDTLKTELGKITKDDISGVIDNLSSILQDVVGAFAGAGESKAAKGLSEELARVGKEIVKKIGRGMVSYLTSEEFKKDMITAAEIFANTLGAALNETLPTFEIFGQKIKPFPGPGGEKVDKEIQAFGGTFNTEPGSGAQTQNQNNPSSAGNAGGNTTIELKGDINEKFFKDLAAREIEEKERTVNQQSGRSPSPGL